MQRLLNLGLILLLALGLCSVERVKATSKVNDNEIIRNDETGIPDFNLYTLALKQGDVNKDGILTKTEASSIKELFSDSAIYAFSEDAVITSLKGIDYLVNLQNLTLNDAEIRDITLLGKLKNLERLELSRNRITDIEVLNGLKKLKYLKLMSNDIQDISSLSKLTELQSLNLSYNNIKDISALRSLSKLKDLSVYENYINDITGLGGLTDLISLDIHNNSVTDITPLRNLKKLQILELSHNNISNIGPLENLVELSFLTLDNNKISDITPLSNLTNLYSLSLLHNQISVIPQFKNFYKLNVFNLAYNNITDIAPIGSLTELDMLDISHNKIIEITPLRATKFISHLALNNNQISDISVLEYLYYLFELDLSNNNITNMASLTELDRLNSLDLSFNKISHLPSLINLTALCELNLDNNYVQDLTPISDLLSIESLSLKQNKINNIVPLNGLNNLVRLNLSNNNISDLSPIKELESLEELNVSHNKLITLPNLKQLVNLSSSNSIFICNNLTVSEFQEKMPFQLATDQEWINHNLLKVSNLKAISAGKHKVKISWDKSKDADGYIIYRRIGNGKFTYRYMVNKTSFVDTTASSDEFNYYRVYPYYNSYSNNERILGASENYDYAKGVLKATTGLRATSSGKKKVTVTWNKVADAEGYIIYRKVGNGKFEYRYIVKGTSFTDTTASSTEYNYYRIYPYYMENGVRILGESNDYKYAKGILSAVTNLKATTAGKNKVKVTWNPTVGAEGYIIYRKVGNGKFEYRYMVKGTSFVDATASNTEYNYYRIYPYHTENGKRIIGLSNNYKYAKASMK